MTFAFRQKETGGYLEKLNAKNIKHLGNIKFISDIDTHTTAETLDEILKKNFWLAASNHKGEESFCLKTHLILKEKFKDQLLLLYLDIYIE